MELKHFTSMKKFFLLMSAGLLLLSCLKPQAAPSEDTVQEQIVIKGNVPLMRTKVQAVTSLLTFYVSAVTINDNTDEEEAVWTSALFTKSGDNYTGGKWWPVTNPSYYFYASNYPLQYSADGAIVNVPDSQHDVVCAYKTASKYKGITELRFKHILTRLGAVTVQGQEEYQISDIHISITPYVSGTYHLNEGQGYELTEGWANRVAGDPVTIAGTEPGTQNNDLYMLPGTYLISASWTATRGNYVESFVGQGALVNLSSGMITSLSVELGGNADPMVLSVSVSAWEAEEYDLSFRQPLTFEVISPGTITWTASSASIGRTLSYSKDGGVTWNELTSTTGGASINVAEGDILVWNGTRNAYATESAWNSFGGTATFYLYGDIASILPAQNKANTSNYSFHKLFMNHTGVRSHPSKQLTLSPTSARKGMYEAMFQGCTGLTEGPVIMATQLKDEGCKDMFSGCTHLRSLHCRATFIETSASCENWLLNVSTRGTFYKNSGASWTQNSPSGIPSGWTGVDE